MSVNKLSVAQDTISYPRWIVLQLLEECNLRCKMCYEWGLEGPYKSKKTLSQLDPDLIKKRLSWSAAPASRITISSAASR
ncbi:hypothetical protein ACFTAO_01965 [Paenibacillus rhizoplanae]